MPLEDIEESVKACYSTWSESYYEDYYGSKAAYPPVHRDIVRSILQDAGAANVLDAGCGPASMLRDLTDLGMALYGFDLTPGMVVEARRVLGEHGIPSDHVWEGSVAAPEAFRAPGLNAPSQFDAAICMGVLPHLPEELDRVVIENLRDAVRSGGQVVVEARNQLFSLFTLNRYSHDFFLRDLIRVDELKERAGTELDALHNALGELKSQFRTDLPPTRGGKVDEPGYDEVLSRTHNPLVLQEAARRAGLVDVRVHFYHFHALPPMLQQFVPDLFLRESVAMEQADDWRGYFMASAFLVTGRRP
jgi:2-polyprenyl-3-methyl-5-hydroxy-6-metoxy-1,4-benzoquinol methylase